MEIFWRLGSVSVFMGTIIYILFIMIKNSNKVCFFNSLNHFIYSIHPK